MAPEDVRRDDPGVVKTTPFGERMARLETKMDQSREDRLKLHVRLGEVEKHLSQQIQQQSERGAYVDILKWGAALALTAVASYFFAGFTNYFEKRTAPVEQHTTWTGSHTGQQP
jgi:hypothetical protein